MLSKNPEEIFQENYKIHVMTELKEVIEEGVLNMEYYQGGHFIAMTGENIGGKGLAHFDAPEMKALLERKLEKRTAWKNVNRGEAGLT